MFLKMIVWMCTKLELLFLFLPSLLQLKSVESQSGGLIAAMLWVHYSRMRMWCSAFVTVAMGEGTLILSNPW